MTRSTKMNQNRSLKFEKIRNGSRLSENVANQIRKAIFEEKLVPGDKLPSEKELAESFGVSRTTAREAIRLLEISGLLSVKPGQDGGSFVIQPDVSRLQPIALDLIRARSLTIEHFTRARMILEPSIVEDIMQNITKEEIELLEQNVRRAEDELSKEKPKLVSNNIIFHIILAECSRNPVIIMVLNLINNFLKGYLRAAAGKLDPEVGYRAVRSHKEILEGIKEGKVDLVRKLMRDHINDVNQNLKDIHSETANKSI